MATVTERKKKTVRMNGCVASAQAAKYADVDVITAYPIRPYTATMMALAQMVANGELDAEYIVADSEYSQLSIVHGAASSGARVAEACAAIYERPQRPLVVSVMAGMGGEAIVLKEFCWMTQKMTEAQKRGKIEKRTHWVGFEE